MVTRLVNAKEKPLYDRITSLICGFKNHPQTKITAAWGSGGNGG
jgi:hypothetical protein